MLERTHFTYAPGARLCALACGPETVKIWFLDAEPFAPEASPADETGGRPADLVLETSRSRIEGVAVIGEGRLLTVHQLGGVVIWQLPDPDELSAPPAEAESTEQNDGGEEEEEERALTAEPADDGPTAESIWEGELPVTPCIFDADADLDGVASRAAIGGRRGRLALLDFDGDEPTTALADAHRTDVTVLAFDHAGERFVSGGRDRQIRVWSADPASFEEPEETSQPEQAGDEAEADEATEADATEEERASRARPLPDDLPRLKQTGQLTGSQGWPLAARFSHDDEHLATTALDNALYLWKPDAEEPLQGVINRHHNWVTELAWSEDDTHLATGSWDATVGIFRSEKLRPAFRFEAHTDFVSGLAFVPADDRLVSAGYDGRLAIWNWQSGELERLVPAHSDWVETLFVVDGGRIATVSSRNIIRIWDLESGAQVGQLGEAGIDEFELGRGVDFSEYVEVPELASDVLEEQRGESAQALETVHRFDEEAGGAEGPAQTAVGLLEDAIDHSMETEVGVAFDMPGTSGEPKETDSASLLESQLDQTAAEPADGDEASSDEGMVDEPETADAELGDEPTRDAEIAPETTDDETTDDETTDDETAETSDPEATTEFEARGVDPAEDFDEISDAEIDETRQGVGGLFDEEGDGEEAEPAPEPGTEADPNETAPPAGDLPDAPSDGAWERTVVERADLRTTPQEVDEEAVQQSNPDESIDPTDTATGAEISPAPPQSGPSPVLSDEPEQEEQEEQQETTLHDDPSPRLGPPAEDSEGRDPSSTARPEGLSVPSAPGGKRGSSEATDSFDREDDSHQTLNRAKPGGDLEVPRPDEQKEQKEQKEQGAEPSGAGIVKPSTTSSKEEPEAEADGEDHAFSQRPDSAAEELRSRFSKLRDKVKEKKAKESGAAAAASSETADDDLRAETFDTSASEIWDQRPDPTSRVGPEKSDPRQADDTPASYQLRHSFQTRHGYVYGIAPRWEDDQLATCGGDGSACLWSLGGGRRLELPTDHSELNDLAMTPDGRVLVAASDDTRVHLWLLPDQEDREAGRAIQHTKLDEHDDWVTSVDVDASGRHLLTGSYDGTARIWSLVDGACMAVLEGHRGPVLDVSWGEFPVTVSQDGSVRYWDSEGRNINEVSGYAPVTSVATMGTDTCWTTKSGEVFRQKTSAPVQLRTHREAARTAAFGTSGTLVTGGEDNRLYVYPPESTDASQMLRTEASVWCLFVEGNLLGAGGEDGQVYLYGRT